MTSSELRKKLDQQPFTPLRFHLSDGMSYDVIKTSSAMILNGELLIGLDQDDEGIAWRSVYIDPHHITRVEVIGSGKPATEGNNGR